MLLFEEGGDKEFTRSYCRRLACLPRALNSNQTALAEKWGCVRNRSAEWEHKPTSWEFGPSTSTDWTFRRPYEASLRC
jgi:hypothetical protein